jgi:hypothetical protein
MTADDVNCLRCGSPYVLVRREDSITEGTGCPSCAYAGWTYASSKSVQATARALRPTAHGRSLSRRYSGKRPGVQEPEPLPEDPP